MLVLLDDLHAGIYVRQRHIGPGHYGFAFIGNNAFDAGAIGLRPSGHNQ